MTIEIATALGEGSAAEASKALIDVLGEKLGGKSPALVMVYASTVQPLAQVSGAIAEAFRDACVIGASTAGEFVESGDAKSSVSAIAVAGDVEAHAVMCKNLDQNTAEVISSAVQSLPGSGKYPNRTALLLLDPLVGVGEEATLAAGAAFGPDVLLAGGAAGDDVAMKETFVSLGGESSSNAAVVAQLFTDKPLAIGVNHGHEGISEPIEVTRAEGNVVYELDGKPAWTVWADATREHASARGVNPDELSEADIGSYLLRYEGGLATGDAIKVRAPLSRGEDGSLSFACGIPEGAKIVITESTPERQVESARVAARSARERLGGGPVAGAIVFDCICRNLILGDSFGDAVRGMSEELGGAPLAGFETYGEIALEGGAMSGFHNTTTVVLAFPR